MSVPPSAPVDATNQRAPPSLTAASTVEAQTAVFNADPYTYFDRESGTWRYENEDGTETEWDAKKNVWVPVVDEDLLKAQQAAYSVAGVDESAPAAPIAAREKKRKQREEVDAWAAPSLKRGKNKKAASASTSGKPAQERKSKNTAVYVTRLPLDTDFDELVDCFSKFGLIEEDDEGEPKVKMYAREDGSFSGEALVVYFKEESVPLAVTMLDDAELRLGDNSSKMRVQPADFSHKGGQNGGGGGGGGGSSGATVERKTVDKRKATRRISKMQKKLEEWGDDEGFGPMQEPKDKVEAPNKNSRVVVLKHMFTLQELEEDASLLLDLKEDVREECSNLGEVTNVVLYDKEPEGVMSVKFRDPLSAQACIVKMNGRFFAGQRVEAFLYSGKQRYRRSGAADDFEGGGEEAEKKRLADFENWLMTEGD